ncbi:uncharacterized protein LOC129727614 [Wyeomyia smithii]|uniref:uncharacterized protein LOC129727614 n=1 Tax=Wyeomyia smithii TaxID=174621 RepID=UPI002467C8FC|nr:uncharacterized protein LOC129727614 [Wyeomyia smithii]
MESDEHHEDFSASDLFEAKHETILEETIVEEIPLEQHLASDFLHSYNAAYEQSIGPEDAALVNRFEVFKCFFRGQPIRNPECCWTVRSSTPTEFQDYLYILAKPYMKRSVEFRTQYEPVWSSTEVPTREDLPKYIMFKDHTSKRTYSMQKVDEYMLERWSHKKIAVQLYVYGKHILNRNAYEIMKTKLLGTSSDYSKASTKYDQKLQGMVRRLKKIHFQRFVPKNEEAFTLWARHILQAPIRQQITLSYETPPESLLENFVVLKKATNPRKLKIKGPAQRRHCSDGYGFEEEVQVLRNTVTQMRDLVEMLDRRVELLEKKCHGFNQTILQGGVPEKENREHSDDEDGDDAEADENMENDEPVIDIPFESDLLDPDSVALSGRHDPDPLLDEIKEESDSSW